MNRRNFSKKVVQGTTLLSLSPFVDLGGNQPQSLDVLVLGGTYFLGPAIVNALVKEGHQVTLFNRGITNPELFPNLNHISGDRELGEKGYANLLSLRKNWDVVIDVWPQKSGLVDDATRILRESSGHYCFISSIAVYNDFSKPGIKENDQVVTLPKSQTAWGYAEHKVASETFVRERFPQDHTILRCGPIKGWRDDALDFPFWLARIKEGEVVGPGDGTDVIQFVDVKDVGNFAALSAGKRLSGTYNLNGPTSGEYTWREFLEAAKQAINPNAKIYWASEDFLRENGVRPWDQMPVWLPNRIDPGFFRINIDKALQAGLTHRLVRETLKEQFNWFEENIKPKGTPNFGLDQNPGITPSKHDALIRLLKG